MLLFWGRQVGVVGSQGVEDSPAVAAQFFAILRAIFPKLVPLRKEADLGSVKSPGQKSAKFPFSAPAKDPLTPDGTTAADQAHRRLKAGRPELAWGQGAGTANSGGHKASVGPERPPGLGLGGRPERLGITGGGRGQGAGARRARGRQGSRASAGGGVPEHLHLLLRPHPRPEVHAGPAGPPPGGVLRDLRVGGRGPGWRRRRGGGISPPRAPAPRVRPQVVHLGASTAE